MSIEGAGIPDEYVVTAHQIFEYCGSDSSSTLRVDALMEKFAPFVKTNKAEYSYLRSLLDPEQNNPEITVSKLADTLNKYSESQKVKVDLDESFNIRNGHGPHDSDSGISTDGFQLLEELQCELREKSHLAHQLRSQLDFTDRQHEEALAALTAERDSLRAHINMLREKNMALSDINRDYEDVCERLCQSDRALEDARRELDTTKKRVRVLTEQVCTLEVEKGTLSELLSKSKEECHRINEMYASRQSALLEHNERLRAEHADLSAQLHDHKDFISTVLKEKVLVEMELKELINKTNQTHLKLDRSIDVSYTDEQMLSTLDSLNAESKFVSDSQILDDESFHGYIKEDQGRPTNISLFDEIRLSFYNGSLHNTTGFSMNGDIKHDNSYNEIATQTNIEEYVDLAVQVELETISYVKDKQNNSIATQTEVDLKVDGKDNNIETELNSKTEYKNINIQTDVTELKKDSKNVDTQTSETKPEYKNIEIQAIDFNVMKSDKSTITDNEKQTDHNELVTKSTQTFPVPKYMRPRNVRVSKLKMRSKKVDTAVQTDGETVINNNDCVDGTKCLECEKFQYYTNKLENDYKNSHNTLNDVQLEIKKYEENLEILKKIVDEGNERNNYLKSIVDGLKNKLGSLEEACSKQKEVIDNLCIETKRGN